MKGYRSTQQPDGTWSITDVPVMAEVRDGERGKGRTVDKAWLDGAVRKAQMRAEQDGYVAPTHVHHHDDGKPTERVGHLVPRFVRRMRYEGEDRWTLFADITDIPQAIYDRIRAGDLPYRSVEFEWNTPEVLSLALMPDEVPFFRFGLLRIAEEQPNDTKTSPQRLPGTCAPAVASFAAGTAERVLFRFQEGSMPEDQEGTPAVAPGGVESKIDKILEMMSALLQSIGGQQMRSEDGDESPAEAMAEEKKESCEDDEKKEEMAAKPSGEVDPVDAMRSELAKLSASNAALSARLDSRDQKDQVAERVAKANEALAGWPLSDKAKSSIEKFAAMGQRALDDFVETYKADVPQDPPKDFESFQAREKVADSEVVLAYAKEGPEKLAAARKAHAMFREASRVPGFRLTEDAFVSDHVERMTKAPQNGREEVTR